MVTLPLSFYARPCLKVAKELLGKYLIYDRPEGIAIGLIYETEAYLGVTDQASHSYKGRTARTDIMFGPAGIAYVYLIYGLHHCFNVVVDRPQTGAAVLIRSVKAIEGLTGRTDGPGRLCKAYGITRGHNGLSLTNGPLRIAEIKNQPEPRIISQPRIGIDYAGADKDKPYRFTIVEKM